ncbi:MAG: hypothetical protein IJ043_01595 [Clostridia bacterium]|nr:hypothetical protein [Clostridia bacterium]
MESGYLYAKLRKMSPLKLYNNPNLTDKRKDAEFEDKRTIIHEKMNWVNDWMITHDREIVFTDINDWRAIGADYDYFWELRSEKQFAKEEAEARAGKSNRTPVKLSNTKLETLITEYMEAIRQETLNEEGSV